jgi:hypothetical protein
MRHSTAAFLVLICASYASAQPARTFVSSLGNDANTCVLASPCRSFQAAANAVATGGEVVALDSAGYGIITIDRSMTVEAPNGIYGGVTVPSSGTGVSVTTVNGTDSVVLRGLTFTGGGAATRAIDFNFGRGVLHVESCVISGFQNHGILIRPAALTDEASIKDTIIRNSGFAIAAASLVSIDNCRLENSTVGLYSTGNLVHAVIRNSVVAGNFNGIAITLFSPGNSSTVDIENCMVVHSSNFGLSAAGNPQGGNGILNVSNTMIAFNATGLAISAGGQINSFGNNKLTDNATAGAFTSVIPQQ